MKEEEKNKNITKYEFIIKAFANNPQEAMNYKQVSSRTGYNDRASKELVLNGILTLAEEGILIEEGKGKYKINPRYINNNYLPKNYAIGKVDMKQTGKAYVIPKDGGEDIFIGPNNTNRALNNDIVKVYIFPKRKDRKIEGQITEIIKRDKTSFVGTIQRSAKFAFFVPDSQSMPIDLFIPLDDLNKAKDGDKVLAEITDWPERAKNPFGKVIRVLGRPGDNNVEMQSILAEFNFPLFFPEEVERS